MGQLKESEETALKKEPLNRSSDLSVKESRQPTVTPKGERDQYSDVLPLSPSDVLPASPIELQGRRPRHLLILSIPVNLPDPGWDLKIGVEGQTKDTLHRFPRAKDSAADTFLYLIFLYIWALGPRMYLRATSHFYLFQHCSPASVVSFRINNSCLKTV